MKFVKLHTASGQEIAVNLELVSDLFFSEKLKATIICFGDGDYQIHTKETIDEIITESLK